MPIAIKDIKGCIIERKRMTTIGAEIFNSFVDEQGEVKLDLNRDKLIAIVVENKYKIGELVDAIRQHFGEIVEVVK